jgi:hypothetical protein
MKLAPLLVFVVLLAACGGSSGSTDSGIRGKAVLGPSCPVEQTFVSCPPKPSAAELQVYDSDGDVVATVRTDESCHFVVRLEPGRYVLASDSNRLPFLKATEATVTEHAFADVTVYFDSGIR